MCFDFGSLDPSSCSPKQAPTATPGDARRRQFFQGCRWGSDARRRLAKPSDARRRQLNFDFDVKERWFYGKVHDILNVRKNTKQVFIVSFF